MRQLWWAVLGVAAVSGCAPSRRGPGSPAAGALDPATVATAATEVRRAVAGFAAASARLDADAVLAYIAGDSAFEAVIDGRLVTGEAAFAALVRTGLPALRALEPRLDSVRVAVLSPTSAIARVSYRQTNTTSAGAVSAEWGVISYGLSKHPGGWRIVYEHVSHLPPPPP